MTSPEDGPRPGSRSPGLADSRRVAVLLSNHIGDTLVTLVIARRLVASGRTVVAFGTVGHALRRWFPGLDLRPLPDDRALAAAVAPFDAVLQMHRHQPFALDALARVHPCVIDLHDVEVGPGDGPMAARFAAFASRAFALGHEGVTPDLRPVTERPARAPDLDNGLVVPPGVVVRRHANRVVVHPEANAEDKCWTRTRFVALADRLRRRGLEVAFVIAPHERVRWQGVDLDRHGIAAPRFDDLDALATFVAESGAFVGNDSGIGHLAANLGLPTLSLFRRRGVAERWRPAWSGARIVLPWPWVPGAALKERYWRETLPVGRVLAAFDRLPGRPGPSPGR